MSDPNELSRRHLLTLSAATSAAVLGVSPDAEAKPAQVPRRRLGKTNQTIPILLVGGGMGFQGSNDLRIKLALEHGANYIDTARKYAGGSSEKNAGATLKQLNAREKTWITSKTPKWSARGLEQDWSFMPHRHSFPRIRNPIRRRPPPLDQAATPSLPRWAWGSSPKAATLRAWSTAARARRAESPEPRSTRSARRTPP
jgi:hypothetical protein